MVFGVKEFKKKREKGTEKNNIICFTEEIPFPPNKAVT